MRVTNGQTLDPRPQQAYEVVCNLLEHEHALHCRAALSRVCKCSRDNLVRRFFQVRIGQDKSRILATKLEEQWFHARDRGDVLSSGGAARERDHADLLVAHKVITYLRPASSDDAQNPWREAGAFQNLAEMEGGDRASSRRFHDASVSRRERWRDFCAKQVDGIVKRADGKNHPQWHPITHHDGLPLESRECIPELGFTFQSQGIFRREIEIFRGAKDFFFRVLHRLGNLIANDFCKIISLFFEDPCSGMEHLRPLEHRRVPPAWELNPSGIDRCIDFILGDCLHLAKQFSREWILYVYQFPGT